MDLLSEFVLFVCIWINCLNWPLRDQTRSASAIQFPPPTPTMVPNMRGLVIVDTRSGLVFEQLLAGRYEVLLPLLFKFLLLLLLLLFQKKNHETSKVSTVQPQQLVRYKSPIGPLSRVLVSTNIWRVSTVFALLCFLYS